MRAPRNWADMAGGRRLDTLDALVGGRKSGAFEAYSSHDAAV